MMEMTFQTAEIKSNGGVSATGLSNLVQIASLVNNLKSNEDSDKSSVTMSTLQIITSGSIVVRVYICG